MLPMPFIRRYVISICLISDDADINDLVKLASTRLFSVKLTIFPFHFLFFTSKSSSPALSQWKEIKPHLPQEEIANNLWT